MPTKLYTGRPRSGKSYECASVVVYNALKDGRRVLSNIAGLNFEEYKKLLNKDGVNDDDIGQIVNLSVSDILKPDFWLTDKNHETERLPNQIQKGDLVLLDEIWRFWDGFSLSMDDPNDAKLKIKRHPNVLHFFRMHGHFTHPITGRSCDIGLITQDVNDVHRSIKAVIDETYVTTKLTAIGLSNYYRLDVYSRTRLTEANKLNSFKRKYNPKYFVLYSSHSMRKDGDAGGQEINFDARGGIFTPTRILFFFIALLAIIYGFNYVASFFDGAKEENLPANQGDQINEYETSQPQQNNNPPLPPSAYAHPEHGQSVKYEITGYYTVNKSKIYILADKNNNYFHIKFYTFETSPMGYTLKFNDQIVNSWDKLQNEKTNNRGAITGI